MSLLALLHSQNNDFTDEDLAVLADWAGEKKRLTPDGDWKRPYALLREGSDTLLRRRASRNAKLKPEASKMNSQGEIHP